MSYTLDLVAYICECVFTVGIRSSLPEEGGCNFFKCAMRSRMFVCVLANVFWRVDSDGMRAYVKEFNLNFPYAHDSVWFGAKFYGRNAVEWRFHARICAEIMCSQVSVMHSNTFSDFHVRKSTPKYRLLHVLFVLQLVQQRISSWVTKKACNNESFP